MKSHIWTQFKLNHLKSRVMRDVINFCEDYGMENFKLIPVTTSEILEKSFLDEKDYKLLIKIKCNWFERTFLRRETKWKSYHYIKNNDFDYYLTEQLQQFYREQHNIEKFYAE